jgi:hypothetical protein
MREVGIHGRGSLVEEIEGGGGHSQSRTQGEKKELWFLTEI